MTNIAVILSGCGHLDGAEIRESVLTLLYLDQQGATVSIFAPDIQQHHVIDHVTGKETSEVRNVLVEAARIARGKVQPLSQLDADFFDALVIPGGYGAAKNLSDLAFKGKDAHVLPSFQSVIHDFMQQKKPIGAICISPAVLAAAAKDSGATLTIGEDAGTASVIESFGCRHTNCPTDDVVIDRTTHIVSCSAYMRDDSLSRVAAGIEKLVHEVLFLAAQQKAAA